MTSFRRVLSVLVMTVVAVSACTTSSVPARRTTTGLVAWIAIPAPPTTSTTTTVPLAPAPFCSRQDLRVSFDNSVGVEGMEAVRLRNIGKVACRLSGYATVVVVTEIGRRIPEVPRHGSYFGAGSTYPVPSSEPADLTPGQTGGFLIGQLCPGAPPTSTASTSIRSVTIYLPHGEGSVDFGGGCFWGGWWDSELGRLIPAPVLPPAPKWPLGSSAFIDGAPGTVTGSTTLHYVVGYSDPSVQLGSLTPCPGYTETLSWSGASYSYSYLLNCGALRALGSGKAAKLAMEIHVPGVPHLEIADLIWRLNTPGWGPEQELSVDISPSSPSIAASTTTTTTPLNGNVISGIKPQVDLAATPRSWVPVAYGDAQISVPSTWYYSYAQTVCRARCRTRMGTSASPGPRTVRP